VAGLPLSVLIDDFVPTFDAFERHETYVDAGTDSSFAAIRRVDLGRSPLLRTLLAMRGIRGPGGSMTLEGFTRIGFNWLGEEPGHEVVLGVVGRFWTPTGGLLRMSPDEFRSFTKPGYAKAAWNFHVDAAGENRSLVTTETRIATTDGVSRRNFKLYWLIVQPFSALIRRRTLALIKDDAEAASQTS